MLRDHLGSTSVIVSGSNVTIAKDLYLPYGDVRYQWRTGAPAIATQTQYRYTSQRMEVGVGAPSPVGGLDRGLYFYQSRYYDPWLGRFTQPDTIVPEPGNPGSLNRYAYVLNNPLRYTDQSGHAVCEDDDCTRVVHPVSGKLVRRHSPGIDSSSVPEVVQFVYDLIISETTRDRVGLLQNLNDFRVGRPASLFLFATYVRQGGPWDPKPQIVQEFGELEPETYFVELKEGATYYYDVWGNVMFGYLGAASGFSEDALLEGAGIEQIGSSVGYTIRYGDLSFRPRRAEGVSGMRAWDHQQDQLTSQLGMELWRTYGLTVTPTDLIQVLTNNPGVTTYVPSDVGLR